VTGETTESATTFVQEHGLAFVGNCRTIADIWDWILAHEPLVDENPAAFAALETALLDLLARKRGIPVEALIGARALHETVSYSAIIGDSGPLKTWLASQAYALVGFSDFKIKLSADIGRDIKKFSRLPRLSRVRSDANNLWSDPSDCIRHVRSLGRELWAIEEPVKPGDIEGMRAIATELTLKVILDESLRNLSQLDDFSHDPEIWVANVRVSKCGGVLRSIAMARAAQSRGMGVVLGSHVGETSLLTRAALAVGQGMNAPPIAREGGFGKLLLERDISMPSLRFSRGGRLDTSRLCLMEEPGWGVEIGSNQVSWNAPGSAATIT
jgi:L-alanine-DL-glutamate epimerase-like enolase superfamily enzyme